jgi:DNA-binding protein YbaB
MAAVSDLDVTLGSDDTRTVVGEVLDAQRAECPVSEQSGNEPHHGCVDRSAVPTGLKQHELKGAERLAARGHRVVFIPVTGKGKIADLTIDDELWELKSISGSGADAVARNIRRAAKQAPRPVPDITDSPITDEVAKRLVEHYARRYRLRSVRVIRGFEGMDWRFDNDE